MKLPHLAKLRSYSYRLQLRASAALALGNPQEAARDIEMIMKLAETIKTEPLLISHLVRVAMLNMAIQPVWEGLQQRAWSERELTILQEVFDRPDLVREFRNAWVGERACALSALDYCRKQGSLNVLNPDMVPVTAADRGGDLSRLIPTGWYLQEMANYSRAMDKYLSTVDYDNNRFYPERVKEFESDFLHKRGVLSAARVLWNHELAVQLIMPSMPRVCYSFAAAKAGVDQTVLVCALEQARLREGTYPATLDSIKASLGDLPRDPVSGEHYVYRPESGGYKLYSTGWDGDDDQGTPLPPGDAEGSGDWVWGFVLR